MGPGTAASAAPRRPQLARAAGRDHPAAVDDDHLVGQPLRLVHEVRAQHHGHAVPAQVADQVPGRVARLRVDTGGRLVQEDQLGAPDHGHRQGQPLLLAAGQPPVGRRAGTAEPDPLEQRVGLERVSVQGGDVAEHLARLNRRGDTAGLEHHPDAGPQPPGVAARVQAQTRTDPRCGRR